ncbi:Hermansky-Pudlak syndrome 4 protein isoform X1 [Colletes latitarsis]|uniref:Hermansky-Pudlak syndrome 4 protein isoform X1 n=1 Tax=Colletes latitarsis TaxID=2605962 RepID=UPI004035601D
MSLLKSSIFVKENADFKLVEMMIVFIYDTARCCKEDDNPAEAVMYFHPAWVSLTQRLALAGQLMSINQFLTTSFATPRSITLQGGKFVLKKFGQYILAVGTDRNIHDWILERRANTLESLLKFFHCDLNKILESFNNDRNKFTEKLYQMFETYLPILQYSANLFSNIPIIKLPKSASNIFLEAIQVLQYCQETNGVMGGALFYNNKVVATQLSADLTKQIVITDPYRIKAPAERISTEFHLPIGVQLLRVYIEQKQCAKLVQEANNERYYSSYLDSVTRKMLQRKSISKNSKELPLSGMKRDTSRIFTVPEEGELDSSQYNDNSHYVPSVPLTAYSSPVKRKQESKTDRPKCINPLTPSVCSTPLKDINRVLHGNAMLICNTSEDGNIETEEEKKEVKANVDDIPDVVKEALRCKRLNKLRNVTSKKKLVKRREFSKRSLSMHDLESSTNFYSNRISVRTYGLGLPQVNINTSPESSPQKKPVCKKQFHTITDPCYPVFRCDGLPVSKSLYEQYISSHYEELTDDSSNTINRNDFLASLTNNCNTKNVTNNCDTTSKDNFEKFNNSRDIKLDNKTKQETYRRSMSLPLKPLNVTDNDDRRKSTSECGNTYDFLQKKKLDGLQLTPLMSKLSLLADERTSGFCSRETTPNEFRDLSGFSTTNQIIKQKLEAVNKEVGSDGKDELEEYWITTYKDEVCLEKTELFLCGHQNMVLVLLMENGTANNPDLIHTLWQTCVSTLGKLETRLQQCLEPLPSNENKELYSILSIDPQWDTINRSGLWGVTELDIVSCLHDRFTHASNLTDIIVRTEDTVVYGNQCGNIEVFYQQAVASDTSGGLPTPADLMGIVSLKAKRRLERDHGIVLL